MKFFALLNFSLLLFATSSFAQNIISNPGFENYTVCPTLVAQMPNATGWFNPTNHVGSADYFHTCTGGNFIGVPINFAGDQAAHGGDGYIGLSLYYTFAPNFREYAYSQLDSTLQFGVPYILTAWVSLADQCNYATDDLQFYFSSVPPVGLGNWDALTAYSPGAVNMPGNVLSDQINWMQVSISFTATGGEQYMTIGNFLNDAATSVVSVGNSNQTIAYLYIDDLDLRRDVITHAEMLPLTGTKLGSNALLNWTTITESGTSLFEIERSIDNLKSWQKAGTVPAAGDSEQELQYRFVDYEAQPGQENYYRLRLVDLNGETHYSNAVAVIPQPPQDVLTRIYPNPLDAGNSLFAEVYLKTDESIRLEMMDLSGKNLMAITGTGKAGQNTFELPLGKITAGTYLLRIRSSALSDVKRIVVR